MKMLYEARVFDLGPGDFLKVECIACGHDELMPSSSLLQGLRLPATRQSSIWSPAYAAASATCAARR
jgi:hypothetical protein